MVAAVLRDGCEVLARRVRSEDAPRRCPLAFFVVDGRRELPLRSGGNQDGHTEHARSTADFSLDFGT
jgi:hypothetical protein